MPEYDNRNSGALFKNEKRSSERAPNYQGPLDVEGTEYWISAWLKKSKAGKTYMSLSIQPKDERRQSGQREPGMDDDIPY